MKLTITTPLLLLMLFIFGVQCQSETVSASAYERLSATNSAILLVDHQTGLINGIEDKSLPDFFINLRGLVDTAVLFQMPVIVSSSRDTGPNGPIYPYITERLPNATFIRRPGEINAWDNADFKAAVQALGVQKLIVAGVSTDVCLTFLALSLKAEGFDVYAVIDASGTFSQQMHELALARMAQAGVIPMTWFAVACELQMDWRNPTGEGLATLFYNDLPFYGNLIGSYEVHSQLGLNTSASSSSAGEGGSSSSSSVEIPVEGGSSSSSSVEAPEEGSSSSSSSVDVPTEGEGGQGTEEGGTAEGGSEEGGNTETSSSSSQEEAPPEAGGGRRRRLHFLF